MPDVTTIESTLSASLVDLHDLAATCERHALCESKLRAMIAVFQPLAESFEVYVNR